MHTLMRPDPLVGPRAATFALKRNNFSADVVMRGGLRVLDAVGCLCGSCKVGLA